MAQLRPIDQPDGPKNEVNYYHCVVSGLPFDLAMQQVVEAVTPNNESEELKALRTVGGAAGSSTAGYLLVPHQLHVFKEKLPQKFAMVTYFLQPLAAATCNKEDGSCGDAHTNAIIPVEEDKVSADVIDRRKKAHELVVKYFTNSHTVGSLKPTEVPFKADGTPMAPTDDATTVAAAGSSTGGSSSPVAATNAANNNGATSDGVTFTFAQPKALMNAIPFLAALDAKVEMLKKDECADIKKLRTWILTKVQLDDKATFVDGASAENAAPSALHLGSAASTDITVMEWAWLRTQHRKFPQSATSDLITAFFVRGFHPYFSYKDTVTVSNAPEDAPTTA